MLGPETIDAIAGELIRRDVYYATEAEGRDANQAYDRLQDLAFRNGYSDFESYVAFIKAKVSPDKIVAYYQERNKN